MFDGVPEPVCCYSFPSQVGSLLCGHFLLLHLEILSYSSPLPFHTLNKEKATNTTESSIPKVLYHLHQANNELTLFSPSRQNLLDPLSLCRCVEPRQAQPCSSVLASLSAATMRAVCQ